MNTMRMTNPPVGLSANRAPDPQINPIQPSCRHPRVQIVSRDEDSEFVECLECREIFESSEFKDMDIEERNAEET
jgi:hypothetical protein